jgi:signal transduction histidine kinase/DNA-binding response OmpR family regulator
MRVVARQLFAPLCRVSRLLALLATALALLGAWILAVYLESAQAERNALAAVRLSASGAIATLSVPLRHFSEATDAIGASDIQMSDRVALVARMLRLQGALPHVAATFLANATGQVLAASSPLAAGQANLADAAWFRRALDAPGLTLMAADLGWLRAGAPIVLARAVRDPGGRAVGLIGAAVRSEDIGGLIDRGLATGTQIELLGADQAALVRVGVSQHLAPADETGGWGVQALLLVEALRGAPPRLSVMMPVGTADATVVASIGTGAAISAAAGGGWAIDSLGLYLMLVWIGGVVLAVGLRSRRRDTATPGEQALTAELEIARAEGEVARQDVLVVQRERDRVLAALGHDLRTPMSSIIGICSLLLDSELESEQRAWLERIRASCETLLAMLNGLLEIASGETGRNEPQTDEVDLVGLLREVSDALMPQARDKGLALHVRCDEMLHGHWLADRTRLRQILFNLLGNAIKYTNAGHVEVRGSVATGDDDRTMVRIAVSDTGPGIAREDRDSIFERYKRGRAGAGHEGLGLGLALCRESAALMGGTLSMESALGVGSEFTLAFASERAQEAAHDPRLAGRTALIVGGDDRRMRIIAQQLGDAGITVETAADGYLGLAMAERLEAQRGALDLVIVQGVLTGMSADVFVIRLRSTPYGRRAIVLLLGNEAGSDVDAVIAAPADPYQVAVTAREMLAERSPFEALEPTAQAQRGGRILVVEDDRVNQSIVVAALSRRGFVVFVAGDGEEAVRLADRGSFDAILMDIQMRGCDGFAATRRIRGMSGRAATIPILALTGLRGPVVQQQCREAGFSAVLEKPVNVDRLEATLRRWLSGSATRLPEAAPEYDADVSKVFLEEMVAVVGMDRARACVAEFVADATSRCLRLSELLPGWEADAIVRSCEEISGLAETCGAIGLGEVLEEIADAVSRNDRSRAEGLMERLEQVTARLAPAMAACLDDIARRWGRGERAA